jgi:pimeloyl-ACP methyl ester carboxylesterase
MMGGPSSLLFAQRHADRTELLVLINAASHPIAPRPTLLAALSNVFLNDFAFWSMVHISPERLLVALGVPLQVQQQLTSQEKARLHAFLRSIVPMGARRDGQLLEQHMSEIDVEQLYHIQAPTLILHARDDTLVPFEHGEFSASHIPGAALISMEKGGQLALMLNVNAGARETSLQFMRPLNS